MKTNSLAFRLFATAAAWNLLVLPIAGAIIYSLYRQEVETSFDRRIGVLLTVILQDSIDHGESEPGAPKDVGEPLFEITHSGWYWQIKPLDGKPGHPLVSRSLAGEVIPLPSEFNIEPNDRETRWANLDGPLEQKLRVAETIYVFGEGKKAQRYSVAVAATWGEVEASLRAFRTRLALALALAGIGLLAVTLFQIRFGLFPLHKVEKGLAAIRSGEAERLDVELPQEIEPLQHELNALLKTSHDIVERARTHVGNLAHALKTPLAVIVNEAREDTSQLARKVTEQAELMHTQVNLYLDRARMAARIGVIGRVTEVRPVAESIIRALERIYRDRQLEFSVDCPAGARFQGERQDLEEMLGNLLDNAAKWARAKVVFSVAAAPAEADAAGAWLEIRVDDDGPGLTPEQLAEPIIRGRRLDETKPGSGLGHSIVADLAHSYRGKFELARSELGGLSARLTLPLAT
ncbi:MAG: sensor histidine kinase [Hyphomicrobiaceae bacterium]|nr:MAG: sensor histidine kinase [Hyphomicrobiaceae bacterium]